MSTARRSSSRPPCLGILFARGFITRDQHDAAQRYARLHAAIFGPVWRQICPLGESHGGRTIPEERLAKLREALDELRTRLTPEQRQAVEATAIYGIIPMWFDAARLGLWELPEDRVEREALVSGLDRLAEPPRAATRAAP